MPLFSIADAFLLSDDAAALASPISFDGLRASLPSSFVLLRKGGVCQPIYGRELSYGWVSGKESANVLDNLSSGMLPDGTYDSGTSQFYCTYGASALPWPVTGVTVTGKTDDSLTFGWTLNPSVSYLTIYATPVGGAEVMVAQNIPAVSSYVLQSIAPATTYSLRVVAVSSNLVPEHVNAGLSASTCPIGYSGTTCATATCSQPCAQGTCTAPDVCTCDAGYAGPHCDTCASGFYESSGACVACGACANGYCKDGPMGGSGECVWLLQCRW